MPIVVKKLKKNTQKNVFKKVGLKWWNSPNYRLWDKKIPSLKKTSPTDKFRKCFM